jgi:hypothetical protein
MIRTVLRLVVILLIAHALYQFVPVYLSYQQFKDDVSQTALFAGKATEDEVLERVMVHAQQRQVPLAREQVQVRRLQNQTFIDLSYLQPVKVLPWYTYPWQVRIGTTWAAQPGLAP